MKVIFTETVKNVASKGDVKEIKPGFFRNFLQPRRLAILAREPLLKEWEERRKHMLIAKEELKVKLGELARRLEGSTIRIAKKVTAKGTLYGGLKSVDVIKALKEQINAEVPEEAVLFSKAIKAIGTYEVKLNLGEGVETKVSLEVTKKE